MVNTVKPVIWKPLLNEWINKQIIQLLLLQSENVNIDNFKRL